MIIRLKSQATSGEMIKTSLHITERIPYNVVGPCDLDCQMSIQDFGSYYLLNLKVQGNVSIVCQRCLQTFNWAYYSEPVIAACMSDALAEKMLEKYESIVFEHDRVDLLDLVTDDLHLSSPMYHSDSHLCDKDVDKYIKN